MFIAQVVVDGFAAWKDEDKVREGVLKRYSFGKQQVFPNKTVHLLVFQFKCNYT